LYKVNTKKDEKIACKKYSGREMDTVAQISVYVFTKQGASDIDVYHYCSYLKYVYLNYVQLECQLVINNEYDFDDYKTTMTV